MSRVTAIVVNYRTAQHTLQAVQSLLANVERIVVVDNDSQDSSLQTLTDAFNAAGLHDRVELLAAPRNGGFGSGNNVAIRHVARAGRSPEYYYFLNPDAAANPGVVQALAAFMDRTPRCGIVGSRIEASNGTQLPSTFRFPNPLGELESTLHLRLATRVLSRWVNAPPAPANTRIVDWVSAASFLVRHEVFDKVGLFDEGFFLYFEEADLCLRARRSGYETWYFHDARVRHEGAVSTGINDMARPLPGYWFDSRRRFFLKSYGRTGLMAANALFAVGCTAWQLRRRLQGKPEQDRPRMLPDFLWHSFKGRVRADD